MSQPPPNPGFPSGEYQDIHEVRRPRGEKEIQKDPARTKSQTLRVEQFEEDLYARLIVICAPSLLILRRVRLTHQITPLCAVSVIKDCTDIRDGNEKGTLAS